MEYLINRQLDELLLNRQKILIDRVQINVHELVPPIEFQEEMIVHEEDVREEEEISRTVSIPVTTQPVIITQAPVTTIPITTQPPATTVPVTTLPEMIYFIFLQIRNFT